MLELSPRTTRGYLAWLVVSSRALQNCMCAVQFISRSRFCIKTSWMRSLKGYKVFWVALIIKENNKDIRTFTLIYNRVVQHFWPGRIFWWRYSQIKVSIAILTNQDPREVHVAISTWNPCKSNWIRSIFCKIHTTSKNSTCKSNPDNNLQTLEKHLYCFKS